MPFAQDRVPRARSVMPIFQISKVVTHPIQIIYTALGLHELRQVKALNWELYSRCNLFIRGREETRLLVLEPFQMDDQEFRGGVDRDALGGNHMVFAFAAVPLLVSF